MRMNQSDLSFPGPKRCLAILLLLLLLLWRMNTSTKFLHLDILINNSGR